MSREAIDPRDTDPDASVDRRHRNRILLIAAATIVLGVLIGYGVHRLRTGSPYDTPAHASDRSAGIVAGGTGPITVDVYVDYQCSACKAFETSAVGTLDGMIAQNRITLVYHLVALLDGMSATEYSTRASASSACAADRGRFLPYTKALFAAQPAHGHAGLSDDQLIQIGGRVGMIDPKFAQCVRDGRYTKWAAHVTTLANVAGMPLVRVNGTAISAPGVPPTVADLITAVNAAG